MILNTFSLTLTVVQIGFEEVLYTVNEGTGQVELGVAVLSGALSSNIVLSLETADNTAQGRW